MFSLLVLIPIFGIIILNLIPDRVARGLSFLVAATLFCVQIELAIFKHPILLRSALDRVDTFFKFGFAADQLSLVMLLCIGIVSLVSLAISSHTIKDSRERFKFINLLMITSIGMSGIVMTRDIFSMYVFIEVTAVASFILIAFKKNIESLEGAFKYIILSAVATVMMLASIALILLISRDTSFSSIHDSIAASGHSGLVIFAVGIFICALFIKGGLIPFHAWLPDAYMSAPASVSILLAGVITKASGIYTLIRIVTSVFGFTEPVKNILLAVGAISILGGAIAALGQINFKRMLAYSSISQVGYIVMGLGAGTGLGIAGAVFHIFNHSVFKAQLFANSAAIEKQAGTRDMDRLGGLAAKMPVTGATSMIAFLSTAGIPPLAGFWSKLIIILALWQAGHHIYAFLAVFASLVTLAYFLSMNRRIFFGKPSGAGLDNIREAGAGMLAPVIALSTVTIGAGVLVPFVLSRLILPLISLF